MSPVAEILVGRGRGGGAVENDEFSENLTYIKGLKTAFSSANGGGGGCRKFEGFVGNLEGFAPPPEKVNFRHCLSLSYSSFIDMQMSGIYVTYE